MRFWITLWIPILSFVVVYTEINNLVFKIFIVLLFLGDILLLILRFIIVQNNLYNFHAVLFYLFDPSFQESQIFSSNILFFLYFQTSILKPILLMIIVYFVKFFDANHSKLVECFFVFKLVYGLWCLNNRAFTLGIFRYNILCHIDKIQRLVLQLFQNLWYFASELVNQFESFQNINRLDNESPHLPKWHFEQSIY